MSTVLNPEEQKKSRYVIALLCFALIVAVLSSMPAVQEKIKAAFSQNRSVLAKVSAFYGAQQTGYLILKIRDSSGLQIEIYETGPQDSQQVFRQKFELSQDSDAYITLDKNTTNLALSDVDKDGQLDIIAPSVDRNGNLRLNTFRFNLDTNSFEPFVETK